MRPRSTVIAIAFLVFAAGCGGSGSPSSEGGGDGSCASIVIFDGREYTARHAVVHPVSGDVIGEARIPGCDDIGQATTPPDSYASVARLEGVDPNIAVVDASTPEIIYVTTDTTTLPDEIARFFIAPPCSLDEAPIDLEGPWLGIIGADGKTELDLKPPYEVMMLVERSSSPEYVRAELSIRVPVSLGTPLTHADVEASLWEGGSLHLRSTCDGEGFVATSVRAFAP